MATTVPAARCTALLFNWLLATGCAAPTLTPSVAPTSQPTDTETATPTQESTDTPAPTPTETPSITPSPLPTHIPQWAPGWFLYEDFYYPYTVAYPRAWSVQVNQWRWGEVRFQSPETGTLIMITAFEVNLEPGSREWVTWAQENPNLVFPYPLDNRSGPFPEINARFLNRDAMFFFRTGHSSGSGIRASMLFAEEGDVYRIYLDGADWLEAERAIYQTMLTTFTVNGESDSDYTVPAGSWLIDYSPVDAISGMVFQVIPEQRMIVLFAPVMGFITTTLEPTGALVNLNGEPIDWNNVPVGAHFQAEGQAGDAGNYLAQHIVIEIRR